jgi:hypothetical protein
VKAAALNLEMIFLVLLSGVLTFLSVLTPGEGLVLTTLIPTPLIILAVKYPGRTVWGLIGLEAGALWLLGDFPAGFFFGQYAAIALVLAWGVRRGIPLAPTIMGSVLLPLILGGLLLVSYGVITQQSVFLLFTRHLDQTLQAVQEQLQTLTVETAVQSDARLSLRQTLPQFLRTTFPALVVINYLFTNVLNYGLARSYCARSQPPHSFGIPPLTHWQVWEYLVWVFLLSGVMLMLPWPGASVIGWNVFLVTLAIYFLQGLAIVTFWGQRLPLAAGVRGVVIGLALVMTGPLGGLLCIALGLFDLWVNFRRLQRSPLLP